MADSLKQGNPSNLLLLRAIPLGFSGSGKRSSQNTILNQQSPVRNYNKVQAEVAGQQVIMVDTPGWNTTSSSNKTPEQIQKEIEHGLSQCRPGPHAILLVVNVDTRFSEEHRRHFEEHVQLLGETVWSHVMVLFTYGGCLRDTTIEEHIDREGTPLRWLVEKCGGRYHVLDNESRGDGGTQVTELLEKIERMVVTNGEEYFEYEKQGEDGLEIVEVDPVAEEEYLELLNYWVNHSRSRTSSQGINRPSLSGEDKAVAEFRSSSVSASCSSPTTPLQSSGYGSFMSSPTSLNNSLFDSFSSVNSSGDGSPKPRFGSVQPDLD